MKRSSAGLITGTGRCGTTFLANALVELHPNIHIEHEIEPTGIGIQNLTFEKQKATIIDGRGRFALRNWTARTTLPAVIESNCFLAPGIEAYVDVWQNCKVVGVVRNWNTCIESMASQSFPDNPDFFYSESDHQKERRPNPVNLGLMSSTEWNSFERLEKIAWYWSYVNGHLLDMAQKHPEHVKLISFEKMKTDPNSVLEEIQEFFQLPARSFSSKVPTNSSNERNQRRVSLKEFDPSVIDRLKIHVSNTYDRVSDYFSHENFS